MSVHIDIVLVVRSKVFLRWGGTTATAESTTADHEVSALFQFGRSKKFWVVSQLRVELARGTALLALTSITSSVATLTVATVATATATERSAALLVAEHTAGGSVGSLLLDVRSGNDLGGKVEPLSEVVETLRSEGVIV